MKSFIHFFTVLIALFCCLSTAQAQVPKINFFAPTSGPIGTTVTITGANFNIGDNDVYFGAIKVNAGSTDGTEITVNVPVGATSVTPIIVRNNLTGFQASSITSSTPQFTVTNTPPLASLNYASSSFDVSGQSESLTVADFDNDGNVDVATANTSTDNVSIRLGDGLGGFLNQPDVAVGDAPYSVAAFDFNNDGVLDMATANLGSNNVSIRLGNGDGTFFAAADVAAESEPRSIAVGDFNGDGNMDLAVQNNFPGNSISIRLGNGDGTFSGTDNIPVAGSPLAVVTGDFDNDFNLDLAVTGVGGDNVTILIGDGVGGFNETNIISVGDQPFSTTIGYFNGDTNLDLATANANDNTVSISLGDGLGGFTVSATVAVGTSPRKAVIGDFNGDGNMDFATNNRLSDDVSIRLGDGAGNFSGTTNVPAGSNPNSIEVADFNNDGKVDLITPNIIGSFVTVLLYEDTANPFITTWRTDNPGTSTNTQIAIPTTGGGYNYTVYWENTGNPTINGTAGPFTGNATIDFPDIGTYRVEISGDFPHIFFNNAGDREKILTIEQWGDIAWTSMVNAFQGCINLTYNAIDAPDLSLVTDVSSMFADASSFDGDLSGWDMMNVTTTRFMFSGASSFNNGGQPLGAWNVSNVTNMPGMFLFASSFNQDIGDWNTSLVNNMALMFVGASSFNQDISTWNVSNVTDMLGMFRDAVAFDQNLGAWDISNVTNMAEMFDNSVLSQANYDATLIGWATLDAGEAQIPSGITLGADGLTYCDAEPERQTLIDDFGWTITGDVLGCTTLPFVTTWRTDNAGTTAANQILIPLEPNTSYDFTVDWGDSSSDTYTGLGSTLNPIHTYATAGTYTVSISGDFPRIYFNNGGDREKILTIEAWGDIAWTSMQNAFYGCANLTYNATDAPDLTSAPVASLAQMFRECVNFDGNATIQDWDVSTIGSMRFAFFGALAFNQPLNNWDVSNVTDMFGLFGSHLNTVTATFNNGEPAGQSTNPLLWNTGNVTDMSFMFLNNADFNQDISSWNVSQVTDMTFMFAVHRTMPDISQFNSPLNTWNVSNVISMHGMFFEAENFDQPLNNWTTNSLTDIGKMFWGARNFNQPIDTWNVSGVTDLDSTFYNANRFNQSLNSWNVSGVTAMVGTFAEATDFDGNITGWQVGNVTDMSNMFSEAFAFNQDISAWNVGNVTNMSNMFANAFAFNQNLSTWDVSQVNEMGAMFLAASAFNNGETAGLSNNPLNSWNTQNLTNMGQMFGFASSFNQDISGWQVGNVVNMGQMFEEATLFNQDISGWDVSQVFRMCKMFFNANAFDQNLATWNISSVTEDPDQGVTDDAMTEMLDGSGLSLTNYDATLIGWATLDAGEAQIPSGITLGADGLTYCDAEPERQTLIDAFGWTITGDALGCNLPPNDACADALPIVIDGSPAVGQTLTATIDDEAGLEDCDFGEITTPGVWYTFVGNGEVLQAATCVADYNTRLSVYSGDCTNLICEAGNDDSETCGAESLSSSVNICTVAGITYYILVHGSDAEPVGNFELTLSTATDVPEITVLGNGIPIVSGDITPDVADDTDFGQVEVGQSLTRTFTLQNTGNADLFISSGFFTNFISFDVSGLAEIPAILAGESITFDVTFTPSDFNVFTDTLIIFSDACLYTFVVRGEGIGTSPFLAAPTSLSVFVNTNNFEVSWSDFENGQNVQSYVLERRTGSENQFATVATIPADGNFTYFYNDNGLTEGITYFYRVKAVAGAIESPDSEIVGVVFGVPTSLLDLNFKVQTDIYPNPSTDDFVVSLESNFVGEIKMTLSNLVGQEVWSDTWQKTSTAASYILKGKDLTMGTYFLMLESGNQKAVFKLIRH